MVDRRCSFLPHEREQASEKAMVRRSVSSLRGLAGRLVRGEAGLLGHGGGSDRLLPPLVVVLLSEFGDAGGGGRVQSGESAGTLPGRVAVRIGLVLLGGSALPAQDRNDRLRNIDDAEEIGIDLRPERIDRRVLE